MLISFVVFWHEDDSVNIVRCINSITEQPCTDFEILIIDCNKDNRKDILSSFSSDLILKYYNCPSNLSLSEKIKYAVKLFFENGEGEYLQFLDSSDYLQIDWLYQFNKCMGQNIDLTIGTQYYIRNKNELFYFNFSINRYLPQGLIDKKVFLDISLWQGGEDRAILSLNNKIIRAELLKKIISENQFSNDEGIAFINRLVFCIIYEAENIWNEKESVCFYSIDKEKNWYTDNYEQHVNETLLFLSLIENTIYTPHGEIMSDVLKNEWLKELYSRLLYYNPNNKYDIDNIFHKIMENIEITYDTSFFESAITGLKSSYHYYIGIKEFIASSKCKYVGFDIFDTLIQRPFWEPTDLFCLINDKFNEILDKKTCIDFSLIRKNGEIACRSYYSNVRPSNEDVNLDEIYDYISRFYGISKNITDKLKQYEIQLELKYCSERKIGKELYDWAMFCGKKIIIASDMYLPKEIVEQILERNSFVSYEKIYLSNDIGISKYSGRLFDYIIKDIQLKDKASMCFIGDNYDVDFLQTQKRNLIPYHVPKASDLFQGNNNAIYSGAFFKKIYQPNSGIIDQGTAMKFIGIRCMMAVVANQIYGNPFVSFHEESDFNADPEFIGYFLAGMFLFAEAKWLLGESSRHKINTIHFVSRDGFFIKMAYDILHEEMMKGASSNYLYFSRKAAVPLFLENKEGIYELFLPPHILSQTPESVVKLLENVVKKDVPYQKVLRKEGIVAEKKFQSLHEFYIFTRIFKDKLYDKEAAIKYSEMLYRYFSEIIHKGDVICDVGYSGRMETALTKLLDFPVSSYYFHEHEPWALMRKRNMNFDIASFYSFKPCSAFVLREQIFTPSQASCIGFEENNGQVKPVFGSYQGVFKEEFILDIIQSSSIRFVKDMAHIFGKDLEILDFNRFDACIPFEYYLHYAKEFDRKVLSAIAFEDEFGTNAVISMKDYWEQESEMYLLNQRIKRNDGDMQFINKENLIRKEQAESIQNHSVMADESIYSDGIYIKLFHTLNRILPIGSRRREFVKRISRVFIH